jgi:hypothetical protein
MNALSAVANFLINLKPVAYVQASTSTTQAMSGATSISFPTKIRDSDGMWNSGSPTLLTVQTPGYYRVAYYVPHAAVASISYVKFTAGTNNPQYPTTKLCWSGSAQGSAAVVCCGAAGVVPVYMYLGDTVEVVVTPGSAVSTDFATIAPASFSMEFVSAGY